MVIVSLLSVRFGVVVHDLEVDREFFGFFFVPAFFGVIFTVIVARRSLGNGDRGEDQRGQCRDGDDQVLTQGGPSNSD